MLSSSPRFVRQSHQLLFLQPHTCRAFKLRALSLLAVDTARAAVVPTAPRTPLSFFQKSAHEDLQHAPPYATEWRRREPRRQVADESAYQCCRTAARPQTERRCVKKPISERRAWKCYRRKRQTTPISTRSSPAANISYTSLKNKLCNLKAADEKRVPIKTNAQVLDNYLHNLPTS